MADPNLNRLLPLADDLWMTRFQPFTVSSWRWPLSRGEQWCNSRSDRSGPQLRRAWKAVYVDYSDKLQRAQIDNAE